MALSLTSAPSASAKGGTQATATSPALLAQAKRLKPLNEIANAVGAQGRAAYADTYSNMYVDEAHGRVIVYVTDVSRAQRMLAAAKHAHRDIDLGRVRVVKAKYTKKALDATIAQVMTASKVKRAADLTVYSAAAAPDGSGVQVTAKTSAIPELRESLVPHVHAMAARSAAPSVPITITPGTPVKAATWRWNDNYPWIGGDVILGPSWKSGYLAQCTTGISAELNGDDVLITAGHCFPQNAHTYGEGDAVGTWGYNYGNYFADVIATSDQWDAEVVDTGMLSGSGTNSDEADQPQGKWYPVDSDAYSYNGQSVCQDGARSYYDGHGVPCGIKVVNEDVTYNTTWEDGSVHTTRGVKGQSSGWAVEQGDSGGLVFSVENSTYRQARGEVSAMDNNSTLYWTEAPDILSYFRLQLNPHQ
ncbi:MULTISPECIES: hypothetical protein [unclassified Streptomyces]|uniref:hypothetical protein n=1 Tax=unclassified Streptomyces TaxID=2593676 RepID=UPI00404366E0